MTTKETFYITTAINYTNGSPHFGHAFEIIIADVIARYHRVRGRDVYFTTGTDEHGQKVAETATAQGLKPIELCDKYVGEFQHVNERLSVSNDFYIRTTIPEHREMSQWLWNQAYKKGDIFLSDYEGWYSIREEKFITETEAQKTEYKDPVSGKPLFKTKESSYFFRMSKYQEALIEHINNHPEFIQPEARKTEILERLKEPLIDLSISRTTFDWGIPVPQMGDETTEQKHIMYVWFDALTNYLTSVQYPNGDKAKYWPANVHVIGKDISWFHCVIWPTILMSCGVPLPKTVLCHGFVNAADGRKMSKSLGNVIEPNTLLDKYPSDGVRYFCMREGIMGIDFAFNEKSLIDRYDSELQGAMGNLVSRALTLCDKYCSKKIPACESYQLFDISELRDKVEQNFANYSIHFAIELVHERLSVVNKWLTQKAPWLMPADTLEEKIKIVKSTLEAVYVLAHFLSPVVPVAMEKVFRYLNTPPTTLVQLSPNWDNLKIGTEVNLGEHIFPRIQPNRHERGKEQKTPPIKSNPSQPLPLDFRKLDLRVGEIVSIDFHPEDPERLYIEKINLGGSSPIQVVSGLVKHIPIEKMRGARVIVLCNMKPSNFKGVKSEAMVLAANNDDDSLVRLVIPPESTPLGERVTAEGYNTSTDPAPPQLNPKKKEWESIKPGLHTNSEGVACYKGTPLTTSSGNISCVELPNANLG